MKNFVMRCNTKWLAIVQALIKKGKKDSIIEISPEMLKGYQRNTFKEKYPSIPLKACVKIRVIIVELSTGEKEILLTSLLDKVEFKYTIFKKLYYIYTKQLYIINIQ